jgi:hypothetical protein
MATTYATRLNVESIIGAPALLACIDDDQDGVESLEDAAYIDGAIERAAVEMNESLRCQYILSALATNDWCKWCNAYIACWFLFERRANPVPPGIIDAVQTYREKLSEIRWGRFSVPEQSPAFDNRPAVSNFTPELRQRDNPIRVIQEECTGGKPDPTNSSTVKRNKSGEGWWN